jgi:hypothetical protein
MATTNPTTGDYIKSKTNTKAYADNYDAIFKKPTPKKKPCKKASKSVAKK